MPSIIIHEEVGYYLSDKINKNSYEYYLGILAPDAVNLEGFAEEKERWTSHIRKQLWKSFPRKIMYQKWKKEVIKFYKKNKQNYNEDFLLGYFIHILTDIIYDEYIYLKVKDKIVEDNLKENPHEIMRKDMDKYFFKEVNKIIEILNSKNISYDILNIEKEKLLLWKEKQIKEFSSSNKTKYITESIIDELNNLVLKNIKILFKK